MFDSFYFWQLMAISKVKRSGGIQKEDPNALKRKRDSPESKQKMQERVLSNIGTMSYPT